MAQHRDRVLTRLVALCLGTSALIHPAWAAVIDYPNGSNNAAPIVLTDNATQLQVLTGSATQSGVISQTGGSWGLEKIGTGTLILTAANTYTGGTKLSAGTLQLGTGGSLASTGILSFGGGIFDLNGKTQTVGGLTDANFSFNSELAINGGTLTVNQATSGTLTAKITGTGTFIYNGPADLTVGGIGTNFNGNIVINGGTLSAASGSTSGAIGGGDLTINGGAYSVFRKSITFGTLSGTGGTINLGGSFLSFTSNTDSTFAGAFVDVASGQITKAGTGTLTLTGTSNAPADIVITAGTLQFGNGGTAGGFNIFRNTTNNGTFAINRSDDVTYTGAITGTGALTKLGSGKVTLTNTNSNYTGLTTISAGTLETQTLNGDVVDNGVLILNFSKVYGGVISGSGSVQTANTMTFTGANTYTGGTIVTAGTLQLGTGGSLASTGALTVNGGIFDLNGHTQSVGALSSAGGGIALGSGALTTSSNSNSTVAAVISGTGSLTKAGTGTLTLTAANTYTGGTTISGGTLQIGSGGTAGSLAGNIVNNAALSFNRSDAATFGGVISGTGTVTQGGSGTLTLSGINTYTGATSVAAGTLNVTGKVAGSGVSVASGAALTGTGTASSIAVAGGGTLIPGNGTVPGTLTVSGNLTLASGATYVEAVTPTATNLTSVSGAASVNGNFTASFAAGTYTVGQRYTVLTAGGGVSGTFASTSSSSAPTYVKPRLSYDANNVYLNLDPNTLAASQAGATANQGSGIAAIDKAVAGGAIPPAGFTVLYGLSGAALNSAVDQISGQIGPNVANAAGQSFLSFMSMSAPGDGGSGGSFAPGSAYGGTDAPRRAKLGADETRVWGAVYGGHVGLASDAASGAAGLSANNVGGIGGADLQLGQGLLVGVSGGFGRQDFRSGNGTGTSDDTMIGLYARQDARQFYVTAAFGLGWHQITTRRTITVSGTDVLQGKQDAKDYGGRVEAGWRIASRSPIALSPYVAVAGDRFETPAYAESVVSGTSTFALSYAAHTSTLGRAELGARLDRDYNIGGGILSAAMHAAWAHRLGDAPFTQASFQALPGASFVVRGVRTDSDTALLGIDLDVKQSSGLFFGVNAEAQAGMRTTILQGMGHLGWRW